MSYFEATDEALDEAYDEAYDEAAPRRPAPRQPVRVAPRGSTYQAPTPASVANSPVTQSQLKAVTDRIGAAIKVNSQAITQVDSRVRTLGQAQTRLESGLRKEISDRKDAISAVRRDLQQTREVSAILPLITSFAGPGNVLASLAPLLLLGNDVSADPGPGNSPGTSNSGLLGGFGGGNSMLGLVAVLALTGGLGKTV